MNTEPKQAFAGVKIKTISVAPSALDVWKERIKNMAIVEERERCALIAESMHSVIIADEIRRGR